MDNYEALLIVLVAIFAVLLVLILICVGCWYKKRQREAILIQNSQTTDVTPLIQRLSQPRIERAQAQESSSLLTCHFYIRTTGEYIFDSQLTQLGSDPEKSWFLVTPISKTNTSTSDTASHILTIHPKSDRLNHINDEESTATYIRTLNNLFGRLHHPYVEPIVRLDILYSQKLVVTVKKYQRLGSLKDLLHGVQPTANFHGKYSYRSSGLSLDRVRLYSRQLLEGLLFLQSKSMPPMMGLHSGNIIATGSCIQIGSYEYQFLEQRSRIYPLIKRATSSLTLPEGMTKAQACEVYSFGEIVFEMLSGYELGEQLRGLTPKHWQDCGRDPDARQMLTRLFDITKPVLTLTEIRQLPYFTNTTPKMKELESYKPMPGEFSNDVKTLLEQWATTTRKKRNSLARTATIEKRKSTPATKQTETTIINLSYTPTIPSTTTSPPPTSPNSPGLSSPPPPPPSQTKSSSPPPPPSQTKSSSPPPPPPGSPPPPPPGPPPPPPSGGSDDRGALLDSIRLGAKLKKTVTNDRSAPKFK